MNTKKSGIYVKQKKKKKILKIISDNKYNLTLVKVRNNNISLWSSNEK